MENIIITNIINEDKININFDLQDGSLAFASIELSTSGDIELNPLIIKLTQLLELNRVIEVTIADQNMLIDSNNKIKLVIETLIEIYRAFNTNIIIIAEDEESLL